MVSTLAAPRRSVEQRGPRLFVMASASLLVGATNSDLAFLHNGYVFSDWLRLVLLAPATLLVDVPILKTSPLNSVVIGTGHALTMLAVGIILRAMESLADRTPMDSDMHPG